MKRIKGYIKEHRYIIREVLRLYVRLWLGVIIIACSLTFSNLGAALLLISAGYVIGRRILRRKFAGIGPLYIKR